MADWSPAIANEFIARAECADARITQMQLQKLVYIAHGWNLAIDGRPLTIDEPEAWDYGPVYGQLWRALRAYGQDPVTRKIRNSDFAAGMFEDDDDGPAMASLSPVEMELIDKVYKDYGHFHAFQLSALTHRAGTPWTSVYQQGAGRFNAIPAAMIREHFVELARAGRDVANA